jgi:hypothetical protein
MCPDIREKEMLEQVYEAVACKAKGRVGKLGRCPTVGFKIPLGVMEVSPRRAEP